MTVELLGKLLQFPALLLELVGNESVGGAKGAKGGANLVELVVAVEGEVELGFVDGLMAVLLRVVA